MNRPEQFDSFSQQVVSHYRQLFAKETIPAEHAEGFHGLYRFMTDFYNIFHEHTEAAGFPVTPPIQLRDHEHHSKHKEQKKMLNTYQKPVTDFLSLLYHAGRHGKMVGDSLIAPRDLYEQFLKSQKRMKANLLAYTAGLGLNIGAENGAVKMTYEKNPEAVAALSRFAKACAENMGDLSVFCFRRGDFNALRKGYTIDIEAILKQMLTESEYAYVQPIHDYLLHNGFIGEVKPDAFDSEFSIGYVSSKIKTASPLFSVRYDMRFAHPIIAQVRFVAMTRITPITHLAPEYIQEELFRTANPCGGCGWCKKQKGLLKPSVLKFGDQKKAVCWFNQANYYSLDQKNCATMMEYIKLHQQLPALSKK